MDFPHRQRARRRASADARFERLCKWVYKAVNIRSYLEFPEDSFDSTRVLYMNVICTFGELYCGAVICLIVSSYLARTLGTLRWSCGCNRSPIMAENTLANVSHARPVAGHAKVKVEIPDEVVCHMNPDNDSEFGHIYIDPRTLPCLHSFCMECLKKDCDKSGSEGSVVCKICRKKSPLPEKGVSGLPENLRLEFKAQAIRFVLKLGELDLRCDNCIREKNTAAAFCCDCHEFLCQTCRDHHKDSKKTLKHVLIDTSDKQVKDKLMKSIKPPKKRYCCELNHEDTVLGFYCKSCDKLVCQMCVLGRHREHPYEDLADVARVHREEVQALLDPADKAMTMLGSAMNSTDKMVQNVKASKNQVRKAIQQEFERMEAALRMRKQTLLDTTENVAAGKSTRLQIQKGEFQQLREEIESYKTFASTTLDEYDEYEVVAFKRFLQVELEQILKRFQNLSLRLNESERMPISVDAQPLAEQISQFGMVTGGCSPAHSTASIHIPRAIRGRERKLLVTARGQNGAPFPYGGEDVKVELRLMGSNDKPILGQAADNGDGTYAVSFTPQAVGEHELTITIRNQQIKGSPFAISVREPRDYNTVPDAPQVTMGNLENFVFSFAIHEHGEIYAVQNDYVRVLKPDGTTQSKYGANGNGDGQFVNPHAVAIRGDMMYIADRDNHRMQKLSTDGKYVSQFGANGAGDGQFNLPRGVCIDPEGRVFVADSGNDRVQVFDGDGKYSYSIPQDQGAQSQIKNPWGLAFDPNGHLHVASTGTNVIKVFTPEGKFREEYGKGDLTYPAGIAIDEEGYVMVVESNSTKSRLLILDPAHKILKPVTGFKYAECVALSKDGSIYVADKENCRVLKF